MSEPTAAQLDTKVEFEYSYPDGTVVGLTVGHTGDIRTALGILEHVQVNLAEEYASALYYDGDPDTITLVDENRIEEPTEEENN